MSDVFDFYPCTIDGKPASIYVNLVYADEATPPGADTRYTLAIRLRDGGEYGIGSAEEASVLDAFETTALAAAGDLVFAGRLRYQGIWELTFYGAAGRSFDAIDRAALAGRELIIRSEPDAAWAYYRELLLPDAERLRWMDDRRLVEVLGEQGDHPARPRRIDHRVTFPTEAARDAFVTAIAGEGFVPVVGTKPTTAQVHRVDRAELEHVHEVVMFLVGAATPQGGVYEGWIAAIED